MPKRSALRALTGVAAAILVWGVSEARGQDVRPLAPILEPAEPILPSDRRGGEDGRPELVPLPDASSRTVAASRDRVRVAAVLPSSWTRIAERYQPVWVEIVAPQGFGLHAWRAYFAASAMSPAISPHPFFSPWGLLSYDGWLYDRYRDVWSNARPPVLLGEASTSLQRGDRLMIDGRPAEAASAYRRVTQSAPDFPIGYFGLGAALAETGQDDDAALAFRQGLERYPAWLGLSLDWLRLYGDPERLRGVQAATAERGSVGASPSRFVAGILHLFGDRPAQGRALLKGMAEGDGQVQMLLNQGPI
jgi:hypothetical protein